MEYIGSVRRWIVLIIGLGVQACGIALSIKADLGVTPISSLPYVGSFITSLTVGQITVVMNVAFVLIQIALLRKKFEIFQIFQIGVAFAFGFFIDAWLWIYDCVHLHYDTYWQQWILCILGFIILGIGIPVTVSAGLVVVPGEGVILAISRVFNKDFGYTKIVFDCFLVAISLFLSLYFMHRLCGLREGTIVAAVCIGYIVRLVKPTIEKIVSIFLEW
ncbi:MAG: hypothetical protein J6M18_05990 [Actinomycetaceae bacterium]|nr:hypothetical protein [Actinomycetaceae bacterium]